MVTVNTAISQIAPNLYCLADILTSERSNAFLVVGDSAAVLFDTGVGVDNMHDLVRTITQLPLTVVLSHWHHDHSGGVHDFVDSRVIAWSSPATQLLHNRGVSVSSIAMLSGDAYATHTGAIMPARNLTLISDETTLPLGGVTLHLLYTPGHTADSVCLHEPSRGWLFTGDTVYDGPIYLGLNDSDTVAYASSVQRLQRLKPALILPGHNDASLPGAFMNTLNTDEIR
jgi:glyoxylase-like metal-dependent hydrolase (beta-lactamase superfamily II)